ncbi:MAG: phage tail sheath subtilisin-like domain-containing protein [Frankiaceae bacterium]
MAVQVSYPGVYVEEFTPGAPIAGVGTGTAAFIGTAASGSPERPIRVQSWDAFVSVFGGFPASGPPSHLAAGVYGFFRNGGTDCYFVRAATGSRASTALASRQSGSGSAEPAMVATALAEGPPGNAVTVDVAESSRLAGALRRALPECQITAVPDPQTLTVSSTDGYAGGEVVLVRRGDVEATAVIDAVASPTGLRLTAALPAAPASTGTLSSAGELALHVAEATVTAVVGPTTLTLDAAGGFAAGDRVAMTSPGAGGAPAVAVVRLVRGNSLELASALPAAAVGASVQTADLLAGQTVLCLDVPAGLSLPQALPAGSVVSVHSAGAGEVRVVASAGGDTVTLTEGLGSAYPVHGPDAAPRLASLEFDLTVTEAATGRTERFPELSTAPGHPTYWGTVASDLIALGAPPAPPSPAPDDPRPAAGGYPLTGGRADDRAAAWADLSTRTADYLDLLLPLGEVDLVAVPGAVDRPAQQAIVAHCEAAFDRFAILDAAPGSDPAAVETQLAGVRSAQGFAALYYPWLKVAHPITGAVQSWPPSGHVAGIYGHTDATRGVHKAPANVPIRAALGVERRLTDVEQGPLNLVGVNALRVFPGQAQPVVWGARTTAGDLDRTWQYVNVRRLMVFLEQSIAAGIRWAVFEPNDLSLWQRLKRSINDFLSSVWRDGALFGATAQEAFYVRIDEVLNPPSSRALGRLVIEVGVAPTYPAEFLVLRIGIWQGGSAVTES